MAKTVVDITVVDAEKRRVPSKHYVYVIHVEWSDGSSMVVYRRYSRFFDLQTQLLDKFPIQAGAADPSLRIIPFLPGKIFFGRSQIRDVAMKRLGEIDAYCKALLKLPPEISQCDEVLQFFEVEPDDLDPPRSDARESRFLHISLGKKQSGNKKADKITGPKQLEQYSAVADYDAQERGEASLQAGMAVDVVEKSESGWWFVNADDHQGWVPSTYLQPLDTSRADGHGSVHPKDGEEERYICIETYSAQNGDELSLAKGVLVEVVRKNMDGWWEVRYQGQVGLAPGTYLKKSSDPYARSLVEKSRHSGVQIVGTLADVSNIMVQSNQSPRNSGVFSSASVAPRSGAANPQLQQAAGNKSEEAQESADMVGQMDVKRDPQAQRMSQIVLKHRSLERGGSLKPPPRQNSVQSVASLTPSSPSTKSSIYVTAADFEDTVGDGISFSAGESVTVLEKTSSGWWFVRRGQDEGWVPEAFLMQDTGAVSERDNMYTADDSFDDSSEEEEERPCPATSVNGLAGALKDKLSNQPTAVKPVVGPPKPPVKESKPAPPALPVKPAEQVAPKSDGSSGLHAEKNVTAGIASALKSKFEKPPGPPSKTSQKPSLPPQPPKKVQQASSEDSRRTSATSFPPKSLDSSLKSKFEAIQKQVEKPSKPAEKPSIPASKPAVLSKTSVSIIQTAEKTDTHVKPANVAPKPAEFSKPFPLSKLKESQDSPPTGSVSKPQTELPKLPTGPPKLPSKAPGSKPTPQSSSSVSKCTPPPTNKKVQDMAAVFAKLSNSGPGGSGAGDLPSSKPTLPGKKPAAPAFREKQGAKNSETGGGSAHVGSLVSELSGKLHFGTAGSGPKLTSNENLHRSPESTSGAKAAPWLITPGGLPSGANDSSSVASSGPGVRAGASKKQGATTQYQAVSNYEACDAGEVSLICGEAVEVIDKQDDWWLVRAQKGEGWAPSSYLDITGDARANQVPKPAPGDKAAFRTVCAFQAESSEEVSFEEGEEVKVLEETDSGWWKIEVAGQKGWAPADYIVRY